MGADPIIYCLEQLTDYDEFERLCHDLMALDGYRGIEPIGGMKDKGRDALHGANGDGTATIFAYSVREDWRKKLDEDATKIHSHKHRLQRLAFLSTSRFTPSERDDAVASVRSRFGWELELYGLERLGVMLRTNHKAALANHPQIFRAPFFTFAGGLPLSPSHDHVVIDHVDADSHVAHWLARRLTLLGYRVWCRGLAPLAGTSADGTIRSLIRTRAFRYVCLWSQASVDDPDLSSRRQLAQVVGVERGADLIIPAQVAFFDKTRLDAEAQRLEVARFDDSYARGLKQIEDALSAASCPRASSGTRDSILHSLDLPNVVLPEPELLASNVFRVRRFPEVIRRYESVLPLDDRDPYLQEWPFRRVSSTEALSLRRPTADLAKRFGLEQRGGSTLSAEREISGIKVTDLLKELIRKSLIGECLKRGLLYRQDHRLLYFPTGILENEHLKYQRLDGSRTYFAVTGERSQGRGERATTFRHHIAPSFSVKGHPRQGYEIVLRIRVHITDLGGNELPGKALNARRKKVCKNWWNGQWLARTLGVMQFLATDGLIVVGEAEDERLEVESLPLRFEVPLRLNEDALGDQPELADEEGPIPFVDDEDFDDEDE
ncbi:MAG: hypothetical protein ACREBE_02910 [bacterium]